MKLKEQYQLQKSSLPFQSCWIDNENFRLYDSWINQQAPNDFESFIDVSQTIPNIDLLNPLIKSITNHFPHVVVFLNASQSQKHVWYEIVGSNQQNLIEEWQRILKLKAFL